MKWLVPILLCLATAAQADPGEGAFLRGTGLEARLGSATGAVLPAGRLTCAGCHGVDAQGGTEGGALPAPAIDWATLSAPTEDRPGYDAAAFQRLLEQGVTPTGRVISGRMPRFSGPDPVLAGLRDHLDQLSQQDRQGLTPDSIAVALPAGEDARTAALAAIAAFNAEGAVFGRTLVVASPPFLDLGQVLTDLTPRLHTAEDTRLSQLLAQDHSLRPLSDDQALNVAGTLDQVGPRLAALSARKIRVTAIGPPSEAMRWAIETAQTAEAARTYAMARAALQVLRDQGRSPGRHRVSKAIARLDMSPLTQIYTP